MFATIECAVCGWRHTVPCGRDDCPHDPTQQGLATALRLAKEATNGWACYAKRQAEHDEIARLHREIAELEGK